MRLQVKPLNKRDRVIKFNAKPSSVIHKRNRLRTRLRERTNKIRKISMERTDVLKVNSKNTTHRSAPGTSPGVKLEKKWKSRPHMTSTKKAH